MNGGFTFCGIDIADIGLDYAPELEDTFVYSPSNVRVHDETIDTHDGSYFYGVTREPKEFTLRCYFEEQNINSAVMAKFHALFKLGKSGKLVFKKRPWCYYYATVINITPGFTNYLNGVITITMKASYPFGRSDSLCCSVRDHDYEIMMQNTAMLDKIEMVPQLTFTNITEEKTIVLPNPGTAPAPLGISIAGDSGEGVSIYNANTKQTCRIVAMSKRATSDYDKHVFIDSLNGKTIIAGENMSQVSFLYHDSGFIHLEPAFPALRNLYASCDGSDSVDITNILREDLTGKYIWLNEWIKIIDQPDEHTLTLAKNGSVLASFRTTIMLMNEITITPDTTMDLTYLSFTYKPTFA